MIKTMLLTAQLALSPIVGTNGLQPKRLPNPVYGETIDYSVSYNGETYTRIMSGDYYATEIIEDNHEIYWGTLIDDESIEALQRVASDNLEWTTKTNVIKGSTDYYIYWESNGEGVFNFSDIMLPSKSCVSFWVVRSETLMIYDEIFIGENNETTIKEWLFTRVDHHNPWDYNDSYSPNALDPLQVGDTITTKDPANVTDWGGTKRNIPNNQPTNANPSVYDNIYNFYYQNLFANEGLDELNANVGENALTMRQWLAHTATIVSISLLACALVILVIKIFKLIAGSISDIWG